MDASIQNFKVNMMIEATSASCVTPTVTSRGAP